MTFLFIDTRRFSSEGMVKTTWKYWMGRRSSPRASIHLSFFKVWHWGSVGSGRSYRISPDDRSCRTYPYARQRTEVLHASMARMTRQSLRGNRWDSLYTGPCVTEDVRHLKPPDDVRIRFPDYETWLAALSRGLILGTGSAD